MLDPDKTLKALEHAPGTVSAVILVAAHGRMPNLEAWCRFREMTGIPVLLDAAAAFDTAKASSIPTVVSLHATKVLGIGEGGFLVTEDRETSTRLKQLTTFGFLGSRQAKIIATNAKLSEYAGAVGMAGLDAWPLNRKNWIDSAQLYLSAIASNPVIKFQPGWGDAWISSVCIVEVPYDSTQEITKYLVQNGIETRHWWGTGCHDEPAFLNCPRMELPVTQHLAKSTIGLPFWMGIDIHAIMRIKGLISQVLNRRGYLN
jgi:dTDP-4-amino-4,6-dideoxygalactose transaminase